MSEDCEYQNLWDIPQLYKRESSQEFSRIAEMLFPNGEIKPLIIETEVTCYGFGVPHNISALSSRLERINKEDRTIYLKDFWENPSEYVVRYYRRKKYYRNYELFSSSTSLEINSEFGYRICLMYPAKAIFPDSSSGFRFYNIKDYRNAIIWFC